MEAASCTKTLPHKVPYPTRYQSSSPILPNVNTFLLYLLCVCKYRENSWTQSLQYYFWGCGTCSRICLQTVTVILIKCIVWCSNILTHQATQFIIKQHL
jgi:hypothetical protein